MSKAEPQTRESELILCHEANIATLSSIVTGGNIPHAFLFSGQRGIGKSTAAYHFAKMILSVGRPADNPNEKAPVEAADLFGSPPVSTGNNNSEVIIKYVAEKVENRNHQDLFIVENKDEDRKNIPVEDIRDIGKFLSLTPAEGKYRVAIIDAIDDFSIGASNAILKILEEPTKNTVIIIICHSKINLLPTIKSRCMELKFAPLSKKDFILVLSELGYTEEKLEDVYELSSGSPGLALEILEKKVITLLERYKSIINSKTVNISEVITLAKEIKEKDAWKVFGELFLSYYSKIIRSKEISKVSIDSFNKVSDIIYFSEFKNMDIQDSLKYISYYINQNR